MKAKKEFPEFCKSMKCIYHDRYLQKLRRECEFPTFPWTLVKRKDRYMCADKLPCLYLPPVEGYITKELEFINFLWRKELGIEKNGKPTSKNIRTNSV